MEFDYRFDAVLLTIRRRINERSRKETWLFVTRAVGKRIQEANFSRTCVRTWKLDKEAETRR